MPRTCSFCMRNLCAGLCKLACNLSHNNLIIFIMMSAVCCKHGDTIKLQGSHIAVSMHNSNPQAACQHFSERSRVAAFLVHNVALRYQTSRGMTHWSWRMPDLSTDDLVIAVPSSHSLQLYHSLLQRFCVILRANSAMLQQDAVGGSSQRVYTFHETLI